MFRAKFIFFLSCFIVSALFFCVDSGDCTYDGDDDDFMGIVLYMSRNLHYYFTDLNSVSSADRRRDIIELREELERLSLKIDVGDVPFNSLRSKFITIRRNAMKKQSSNRFVFHNFDRLNNNRLGGEVKALYEGRVAEVSPWLRLRLLNEANRIGKKMLRMDYDVSEGDVALEFGVTRRRYFRQYNALSFDIKGDINTIGIKIIMKDGSFLEGVIGDIKDSWQTVSIPFEQMEGSEQLRPNQVNRVQLIIRRLMSPSVKGTVYLDSCRLRKTAAPDMKKETQRVYRYQVEGTVPLGTNKSLLHTR